MQLTNEKILKERNQRTDLILGYGESCDLKKNKN